VTLGNTPMIFSEADWLPVFYADRSLAMSLRIQAAWAQAL